MYCYNRSNSNYNTVLQQPNQSAIARVSWRNLVNKTAHESCLSHFYFLNAGLIRHVSGDVCVSQQSQKVATNYMPHRSELMVDAARQNIHCTTLLLHCHQVENESGHQNIATEVR